MKRFIYLLFLIPFLSLAQDFSDEDYIFLKRHEYIKIDLKDRQFNISKRVSEQAKFLTSKKLFFANKSMPFDSFTSIKDIEAFTILPDSDQKVEVNYIETKREFENGIFYSDQESKNFTFPAVSKGAITSLDYTEEIKDPHFMGMFGFGSYAPTQSAQLSIEFPKNVTIGYVDFNTANIDLQFNKQELTDKNIYTWSVENIKGFQAEEDSESALYYLPHIIVYIKNYKYDNKKENVLNDVSDLYHWYTTLVEQIDDSNLEKVHAIADKLVEGMTNERDKAETIFNWVQNNITYVAFEDGLGGFVPRGAASVSDKRYGDCKDMANLLFEMLNHVGIESYRTWIGTRDRNYSYLQVPTPMVDNHMINTIIVENDTIFLDATDSYVPFGLPSSFIQTKEALLGIDKNSYRIVVVPAIEAEKNTTHVTSIMTLTDQTLNVVEERQYKGYEKVEFVSGYTYKKGDKKNEEYLNSTLKLGNNKTDYSDISLKNFDNSVDPLNLGYDLTINSYARSIGEKVYLNLNIDKTLSNSNINVDNRKYSKKIDHKFIKKFNTILTIPKDYVVSDLPDETEFTNEDFNFNISYSLEGDKIVQSKIITVNTLSIKNDQFTEWNDFIKSLIKSYKKSIILEKK